MRGRQGGLCRALEESEGEASQGKGCCRESQGQWEDGTQTGKEREKEGERVGEAVE